MADNTKPCSKCKKVLPVSEFYLSGKSKDGKKKWYRSQCKGCSNKEIYNRQKERYNTDSEYRDKINKKNTEFQIKKYQTNPEYRAKKNKYNADWIKNKYDTDPEFRKYVNKKSGDWNKQKYQNDPEYRKQQVKRVSKYVIERYKTDEQFAIKSRIRASIAVAFKNYSENGKMFSSSKYGIDYEGIINKLGSLPADGYDIDHIIPISLFDHDDKEQVKLCWAAENLQWMEHIENIKKSDDFSENMEDYPEELHEHWKVAYKNYLNKKGD